jgi:hypothetical protein
MLRWCNQHCSCQVMVMTYESRKAAAALLYESFSGAVDIGDHARALLIAMQSTAEAGEQMKCILANALRRSLEYPNSPMLVYIAKRREAQSEELRVFLVECSTRITEASKDRSARPNSATASWIDFLGGWLSKVDTDLVDPESLDQAARTTTRPLLGPTTPYQTPMQTPFYNQGPATGAAPPATGGGGNSGAGRGTGGKGAGNSGGGQGAGGATGAVTRGALSNMLLFRKHMPCSGEIIGTTLGVNSAAPPCKKCNVGNHYHGECPVWWGSNGTALPGFDIHGQRIPGDWHGSSNEPLKKTMKAWVAFLEDHSHFNNAAPTPAGVAGAPDLARFQARVLTAPVRP